MTVFYLDYNVMRRVALGEHVALRAHLAEHQRLGVAVPFSREHVGEATRGVDMATEGPMQARVSALLEAINTFSCSLCITPTADGIEVDDAMTTHDVEEWMVRPCEVDDPAFTGMIEQVVVTYHQVLDRFAGVGVDVGDLRARLDVVRGERDPHRLHISTFGILFDATSRATGPLDAAGLGPRTLNNVRPHDVFDAVAQGLTSVGADFGAIERVASEHVNAWAAHPASRLGMLMGYRRDGPSMSTEGRLSDIAHADIGLRCSAFITDDAHLRDRCQAVVAHYGLAVKVCSSREALDIAPS